MTWQTATAKKQKGGQLTQDAARTAADMRSAFHAGMSYSQPPIGQGPSPFTVLPASQAPASMLFPTVTGQAASPFLVADQKPGYSQAEWVCSACNRHNFLTRAACRACGAAWSKACDIIPAAPREKPPARPPGQGSSTKVGAGGVATTADAADAAVAAAKAAGSPAPLIEALTQQALERRQEQTARLPLSMRLKSATAKASETAATKTKADKALESAR